MIRLILVHVYMCLMQWKAHCYFFTNIPNIHVSRWNIYHVLQMHSLIECSLICDTNATAMCTRLMWSNSTQTCMLHSEEQVGLSITLPSDASWFVKKPTNLEDSEDQAVLPVVVPVDASCLKKPANLFCNNDNYEFDFHSNSCVRLVMEVVGKTWTHARSSCQDGGGDLLSITTVKKMNFVVNYIYNILVGSAWVGIRSGTWVTGDSVNLFNGGHLNNYDGTISGDSDNSCGRMDRGGYIGDDSCNIRTKQYYLCEILV